MEQIPPAAIETQLKSIQQLIQTAKFNDAINQSTQLLEQTSDKQNQIEADDNLSFSEFLTDYFENAQK